MNKTGVVLTALFITALGFVFFTYIKPKVNLNNSSGAEQSAKFQIISTNPEPLEGATILPTQYLEFTFNKPLFRSQFKHEFDPGIEHEVEVVGGRDKEFGATFRIIFKKPLELGAGYTLFVLPNTSTEEKEELGREYIYHFKTIQYKGV